MSGSAAGVQQSVEMTPESTSCDHCGLPVPRGLIDPDGDRQFCCRACAHAFGLIHSCGLERYYSIRDRAVGRLRDASSDAQYAEYDSSSFEEMYHTVLSNGLRQAELAIAGLHCPACVWLLESLPRMVEGVIESRVHFSRATLTVRWNPELVRLSQIARVVDDLGYPSRASREQSSEDRRTRENRAMLIRLGAAGAIAGNVMLISFALYSGESTGIAREHELLLRVLTWVLGMASLLWPASIFYKGALASLRQGRLHLDLPIAIGLIAGGIAGTWHTIVGEGDLYFDSLTSVVFLLLIGRMLQQRHTRWASDAVELLYTVTPHVVRKLDAGGEAREVDISEVATGDRIEVRPGDTIAVDGTITEGATSIDTSFLSGESLPSEGGVGDDVRAGAINVRDRIVVRVEASGASTHIARIMDLVERASRQEAPIVRLTDRIAGWFVGVVIVLAAVCALVWWRIDSSRVFNNTTALLIVSCPCALGLATPMAISVAIGRAARRGILIRHGEALEQLARTGDIWLDKTGTLTRNEVAIQSWHGDVRLQPLAAALEAHATHPYARAIRDAYIDESMPEATDLESTIGGGVSGLVDGSRVAIGTRAFVQGQDIALSDDMRRAHDEALRRGYSPMLVAHEDVVGAVVSLGDGLRDDARSSVDAIRRMGWRIGILSGDHEGVVRSAGEQLGVERDICIGSATPVTKHDIMRERRGDRVTVMVGDGVNDAAALRRADVGIAVHGGAEATEIASDVSIGTPGVRPLVDLLEGSRRTIRVIKRNLALSLCYNALAAGLAMTGFLTPLLAAVLMPISSITVITLSFKSRTFGD
ncbi:MAG: heavy metal translocating P-type ATPase [Planctomycetota bacterium]|jgi:Cu2+-exporting ATPase